MRVLETVKKIDLAEDRVAVSGDWHGNVSWIRLVARATRVLAPDVRTILQLGDWWADEAAVDEVLAECGIERVLVTLGNHEDYGFLRGPLAEHRNSAIRVTPRQWVLSRPFRFRVGGRRFLSVGGASSVDRLAPPLGLPALPVLAARTWVGDTSLDWKVRSIAGSSRGRPVLWVDDRPWEFGLVEEAQSASTRVCQRCRRPAGRHH